MTKKLYSRDEDHEYYGRSWWTPSIKRIGCLVLVCTAAGIGLPLLYTRYLRPTRAVATLAGEDASKREKLDAIQIIIESKFKAALPVLETRLADAEEDLAVRGAAAKAVTQLSGEKNKTIKQVFTSSAPPLLKMEILKHLGNDSYQIVSEVAGMTGDDELRDACRDWLDSHREIP